MTSSDDPTRPPTSGPGSEPGSAPPPGGPPPGGPPPEGPPPGGPPPGSPPPGGPPKKGLSTGAKIAIGCGALAFLGLVVVVLAIAAGGLFLRDRADDFVAGIERQAEVTERMERLQRERPFQPPEDGVVTERQARTFFAITDDAWEEMEGWADEMADLGRRMERDEARLRDMAAGVRGAGRFVESRAILADAMVEHEMTVGEYLWTGLALLRARDELERPEATDGVPPQNLALARSHRSELDEIARASDDDRASKGTVLNMAMVWGMADMSTWRALGLDTLQRHAR